MEKIDISNKITPQDVARIFNVSVRTLEKMRLENRGPGYVRVGGRFGRVYYDLAEVSAWYREADQVQVVPNRYVRG